jgi:DNA modification methylase
MNDLTQYKEFLKSKVQRVTEAGFTVDESMLNKNLFDFQRYIVAKALKMGKYAVFADCGLGKTLMQLEWAHHVSKHTGKPVLILCPLAVAGQTIKEGEKFGIKVQRFVVNETVKLQSTIYITNYDQLDNVNPDLFSGIVLDESGIIKNHEGATKNLVIDKFQNTPYKLACTATPSPNDFMELGNHSEFLNIMPRNEMLAMYFVHDGGETAKWRLKGHSEKIFWKWVASWAVMLTKPSDIGFSADGYDLPSLNYIEKQIVTSKRDNGTLFNDVAVSATDFNGELRLTKVERMSEVVEIVNNSDETFIIWIKHNDEGDYLKRLIPDAVEVRGNDSIKYKEDTLLEFADGKHRVLITKSKIAQYGLNFQNCHNQIFASLDFSFESLYQSIRRSYRFGQKNEVNIYIVTTDTMQNVIQVIQNKQKQFENMQKELSQHSLESIGVDAVLKTDRQFEAVKGEDWEMRLGDCVQLIQDVEDESIGFSVFSPPFASLYTYSDQVEDMGNSKDYNEFTYAFTFLAKELHRVLKSGRNVAVHCMDLPIQKGKDGFIGLRDFSGMILKAFDEAGFVYHSRVTIWKNPVTEMQRTKALGLLHKQVKKDSTMSRVGIPDYVLVFRKDGDRYDPVRCEISVDTWQKYASPVWMDIDYGDTMNARSGREDADEAHICPLQLPTIERLVVLYSNHGDTVLTPFGGIGSELVKSVELGRKAIGFELKKSYFDEAVKNCKAEEKKKNQLKMF